MPRVKNVVTSFNAGELDPRIFGRLDTNQYQRGLARARNVFVTPQGGAFRRGGTVYHATTTSSAEAVAVPFAYKDQSTTADYLLVFTAGQFQVFLDGVLQATVTSSPISALTLAQIKAMTTAQDTETLVLFNTGFKPIQITRTSHTAWTAAQVSFSFIPPHAFGAVTQTTKTSTLTPTADPQKDTYTMTSSAADFSAASVGQTILVNFGVFLITAYTSSTVVTALALVEPSSTSAATKWIYEAGYEDAWSVSRGWPACGAFFQGRLWMAGGSRPNFLSASRPLEYYNFLPSALDDGAIDVDATDSRVSGIQNLFSGRQLQIFSRFSEAFVTSGSTEARITPSNIVIKTGTFHGSSAVAPVSVDGSTIFVEKNGQGLREFVFTDLEQSYQAPSLTDLAAHLIVDPVRLAVRGATADLPSPYVFVVNSDGTVAVVGRSRSQEFLAFTLWETQGSFEDVAVVGEEVYFIVKRTIDGNTRRFIERLSSDRRMDAGVVDDNGSPTTSFSGFGHLNGEECEVLGDGALFAAATPASGAITTDEEAEEVEVGLPFRAEIQSLPLDADLGGRLTAGDFKRIVSVNMRLYKSRQVVVERTQSDGTVRVFKPGFQEFGTGVLDAIPEVFTGWKKVYIGGVGRDIQVTIKQEGPFAFGVLSTAYEFSV